jgi:histidinol-phosphatase (PHP family)
MLTDYHVHLRPDGADSTAAEYFTQANVERYREAASERGIAELGVSEHVYRFTQVLDVWEHPFWRANARDDIDEYCDWGSRPTSYPAARTAWPTCCRRGTSTT